MFAIRQSFVYDTLRQGYDATLWRTLAGAPACNSDGRLEMRPKDGSMGAAVSYTDITKGDISFDVNIPTAPNGAYARYIGLSDANTTQYARFKVGANLVCETSNGVTTTASPTIVWDSNWEGVNTRFQIVWQSGFVKFYIDGVRVYQISDNSIPYGPLSLYLFDNSASLMTIGNMNVRGAQSIIVNPATTDHTVIISSSPSVSPSISTSPSASSSKSPSVSPSVSTSPSISPSESVSPSVSKSPSLSPSVSPSESVSPSISASPSSSPSVSPSVSASPSVSPSISASPSKSSSVSPSASVSPSVSASPSPSPSLSPSL